MSTRDTTGQNKTEHCGGHTRSRDGQLLHTQICELAFQCNTRADIDRFFPFMEKTVNDVAQRNPHAFLDLSANECTHLIDALHLCFAPDINCPNDLRIEKAKRLFKLIIDSCHKVTRSNGDEHHLSWVEMGEMMIRPTVSDHTLIHQSLLNGDVHTYEMVVNELDLLRKVHAFDDDLFAACFTLPTTDGMTPMHYAVKSHNTEICDKHFEHLKDLRDKGKIDEETFKQQFISKSSHDFTPLISAIKAGDAPVVAAFIKQLREILTPAEMRTELNSRTQSGWNIFHTATQCDIEKGTPNGLVIDVLHKAMYDTYGRVMARENVKRMYAETTDRGTPAYHNMQNPAGSEPQGGEHDWFRRIMSYNEKNPLQPRQLFPR